MMKFSQITMFCALLCMGVTDGYALDDAHVSLCAKKQKEKQKVKKEENAFISLTLTGLNLDSQKIDPNQSIKFNHISAKTQNVTYHHQNGTVTLSEPGDYEVTFGAIFDVDENGIDEAAAQILALKVDGGIMHPSRIASATPGWTSISLIIPLHKANSKIEVINAGTLPLNLLDSTFSHPVTMAYLTIKKIVSVHIPPVHVPHVHTPPQKVERIEEVS